MSTRVVSHFPDLPGKWRVFLLQDVGVVEELVVECLGVGVIPPLDSILVVEVVLALSQPSLDPSGLFLEVVESGLSRGCVLQVSEMVLVADPTLAAI